MALLLREQNRDQFLQRFREAFRVADGERYLQLARFALNKLQSGDITDAEFRSKFGKTVAEWNSLKGRMNAALNGYNAFMSARGE